jgi:hypothetical protein
MHLFLILLEKGYVGKAFDENGSMCSIGEGIASD